jgi:23S rRNA (pseudouridine1915-N3)-methyltransferase
VSLGTLQLAILAVGRLRDANLAALCAEYERRLSRMVHIKVVEVKDAAHKERTKGRDLEGEALLKERDPRSLLVALDAAGKTLSSPELADWLVSRANRGESRWCFAIGGPDGLGENVASQASERLSLSRMTFPHELARLILLEQLYRAVSIARGLPYHRS